MKDNRLTLEVLEVASPCEVSWDAMRGDDVARFCDLCKLNVYNLSGMTRSEAETLINEREGRVCIRLLKRRDGTVLTQDCPVGLQAVRRRIARLVAAIAAMLTFMTFGAVAARSASSSSTDGARSGPLARIADWLNPHPELMAFGSLCVLPTTTIAPIDWPDDSIVDESSDDETPPDDDGSPETAP